MKHSRVRVHPASLPRLELPTPRGTVLMLPGRETSCEISLLAWTTRALQESGWAVHHAAWSLDEMPEGPDEYVTEVAERLDELERPEGPVLVVAKSLGTRSAAWAAERGYPAVWLTPNLSDPALAMTLAVYPVPSLVVGGTDDPMWDPAFIGTPTVMSVPGADHALEMSNWRESMRMHERVAEATARFADGLLVVDRVDGLELAEPIVPPEVVELAEQAEHGPTA